MYEYLKARQLLTEPVPKSFARAWRAARADTFEAAVAGWPEVVQCATVTGEADYVMRIITRDMHAFDDFLRDQVLSLGLVSNVQSRIVMRSVKNSPAIPLGLVAPPRAKDKP